MRKRGSLFCVKPVLFLCLLLFAGGCAAPFPQPVENLIRPPCLPGAEGELQQLLWETYGSRISLVNPLGGTHTDAVTFIDLQSEAGAEAGEDTREAVVFYRHSRAEDPVVQMAVYARAGEEWKLLGALPGEGTEVLALDFLSGEGFSGSGILVRWRTEAGGGEKSFSLYSDNRNTGRDAQLGKLRVQAYDALLLTDIDGDGWNEIVYASAGALGAVKYRAEPTGAGTVPLGELSLDFEPDPAGMRPVRLDDGSAGVHFGAFDGLVTKAAVWNGEAFVISEAALLYFNDEQYVQLPMELALRGGIEEELERGKRLLRFVERETGEELFRLSYDPAPDSRLALTYERSEYGEEQELDLTFLSRIRGLSEETQSSELEEALLG